MWVRTQLSITVSSAAPWAHLPGILCIDVPDNELDADATVIKIELEGPLDLYTAAGDVVTMNV